MRLVVFHARSLIQKPCRSFPGVLLVIVRSQQTTTFVHFLQLSKPALSLLRSLQRLFTTSWTKIDRVLLNIDPFRTRLARTLHRRPSWWRTSLLLRNSRLGHVHNHVELTNHHQVEDQTTLLFSISVPCCKSSISTVFSGSIWHTHLLLHTT